MINMKTLYMRYSEVSGYEPGTQNRENSNRSPELIKWVIVRDIHILY